MTGDRVPLRHSLVTRLLVTSVLIAIASISATAWLAASTATRAISQEQGNAVADDKAVYDMLIAYAIAHRDWSGAAGPVRARAAELGRRITLTTEDRTVIADTGEGPSLRTARPSAVLDPLDLDLGLTGGTDRIDARVVGPYGVPANERAAFDQAARNEISCLGKIGHDSGSDRSGSITMLPSGRPEVVHAGSDVGAEVCVDELDLLASTPEEEALRVLAADTARCLGTGPGLLRIAPDFRAYLSKSPIVGTPERPLRTRPEMTPVDGAGPCVEAGRRTQLRPYVAPRALLFVTAPGNGTGGTTFSLSRANVTRVVATTAAVLLATVAVTVLVGRRLVRPLRDLADSADRRTPALAGGRDEIGRLARALERTETQRRTMVSDVAHELRTPLGNIRTWLEAAQDDLAPTDAQLLALLHEEALQLQAIIDDLGDLAAADAGTLRLHVEPVRLREALAPVVDGHLPAAHAAGVRLDLDVVGDPVVQADPVRLRQLVGNLVSNAIRYTPAGGVVTVGADGPAVTVRDTGVGIAPEDLPRIFDRFWRAEKSRSRATGGSGLGLAIARQLAEAHGGGIEVASEPGRGTVFTVRLYRGMYSPPA